MLPTIQIGGSTMSSLGLMLAIGIVLVLLGLRRQSRLHDLPYASLHVATLAAFAVGAIGCRVLSMLVVERRFVVAELTQLADGTMYFGFLLGAALGATLAAMAMRLDPIRVLDACVPAWLVAQIAGRIGCFLAGCCYGHPTDLPWGVEFPSPHSHAGETLHPTQLYEALGVAAIWLGLLRLQRRPLRAGTITLLYVLGYSTLRFCLEFMRADNRGSFFDGALSSSQTIALVILITLTLLVVATSRIGRGLKVQSSASDSLNSEL